MNVKVFLYIVLFCVVMLFFLATSLGFSSSRPLELLSSFSVSSSNSNGNVPKRIPIIRKFSGRIHRARHYVEQSSKNIEIPNKLFQNALLNKSVVSTSTKLAISSAHNISTTGLKTSKHKSEITSDDSDRNISQEALELLGLVTSNPTDPCPMLPPKLVGPLKVMKEELSFEEIASRNPGLRPGGLFAPPTCKSRHRVAIVIPYRNREPHLKVLLHNLHPMLERQQLEYGIFVIDQELPGQFNRALLMNIGFVEAIKRHDYQCVVFHDVDLIPENDNNIYSCPHQPRHMSIAIDKFEYRLPYNGIFGGVCALSSDHFRLINGYSNLYFGWGGEDDDIKKRIDAKGLKVIRYPMQFGRYSMIKHTEEVDNLPNPKRWPLLRYARERMRFDGLSTLKGMYNITKVELLPTHTRIAVLLDDTVQFSYRTGLKKSSDRKAKVRHVLRLRPRRT